MPTLTTAAPSAGPHEFDLRRQLRQRLLGLPYRGFLQVVIHLLRRRGYTAARPAGRTHWKGRNRGGGWDAEADFSAGPLGTLRTVVQVKQFGGLTVHRRQVDELRGSCLRAGAQQALLVTLSAFSPAAREAADAVPQAAPVGLIDGDALLDLLMEYGLGVTAGRDGARRLDEAYFRVLQEGSDGRTVQSRRKRDIDTPGVCRVHASPSVTVIVWPPVGTKGLTLMRGSGSADGSYQTDGS